MSPLVFGCASAVVLGSATWVAVLRPTWIVDRPRLVLGVLAALTLGMGASLFQLEPFGFRIGVDASSEPLLPNGDPGEPLYQRSILQFGDDDVLVVAMQADDVFTHDSLQTLREVSDEIRKLEGVRGTESLVDVYAYRFDAKEDLVEVGRLIDEVPSDPAELADLRRRALADPIYPRTIVAKDGGAAAINVTFDAMTDGEFARLGLDEKIHAILDAATHGRGVRFHMTGRPHIRAQAQVLLIHDMLRLIPIAVLVSVVALWLMTGSLRGTLVPLAANLTATLWAFGAMALVGSDLNIVTLVLGPMMITIGGAFGVHAYAAYESVAPHASSPREAALGALRFITQPVLISGLTTMVGFAAQLVNDIPATNELTGYCVFGSAVIAVITLTGLPATLALLPLRAEGEGGRALYAAQTRFSERLRGVMDRGLLALGRFQIRRPRTVLLFWVCIAAAAASQMPRIVTDTDFIKYFRPDSEVRQDFDAVNRLLTGAVPLYVVLEGATEGTFREPASLHAVERLQARIAALPGVTSTLSAVDLVKLVRQALEQGDPAAARIPDSRLELSEIVFMIPKEKLRALATSNHSSANIAVRTDRLGSAALRELEDAIRAEIAAEPLPAGVHGDVTGNTIRINRGSDGIAGRQAIQMLIAVGSIFVIVAVVFGSIGLGLLAMPTNVMPVVNFYGLLGAGVAPLSVPTSLIGSISLGISIDDTCHFLQVFRHTRAEGKDAESAVMHAIVEDGRPMVVGSLMEIAGFLVMLFSSFATLQQFGYLTAITMGLCLATDVMMLPALLVALKRLSDPRAA